MDFPDRGLRSCLPVVVGVHLHPSDVRVRLRAFDRTRGLADVAGRGPYEGRSVPEPDRHSRAARGCLVGVNRTLWRAVLPPFTTGCALRLRDMLRAEIPCQP